MNRQIAVVGDGVSAGLAVFLLSKNNFVTLIKSKIKKKLNPIPEFVPYRDFFEALKVSDEVEKEIIEKSCPKVKSVTLYHQGECVERDLLKDGKYFFYDKSQLASWLISSSNVEIDTAREIKSIIEVEGFDLILDCRGSHAVSNDVYYSKKNKSESLTQCSYMIFNGGESITSDQMTFWIKKSNKTKDNITLFSIPVGESEVSFGCSSSSEKKYSHDEVVDLFFDLGIDLDKELVKFSGEAKPNMVQFSTDLPGVKAIGEAFESSCPLTEFGVMKALQQIVEIEMSENYSLPSSRQSFDGQFDPHIPMELFT